MPREKRSILHGTVYDIDGNRIVDAVVRLFCCEEDKQLPVADTFTDGDGEFVFGPIMEKNYLIKVYAGGVTVREITVRPRKRRKPAEPPQ